MRTYAILKDPHFRFGLPRPIGRTEQFETEIQQKLNQILTLCIQTNCTDIIITGDVFDVKAISKYDFGVIRKLENIFEAFKDLNIKIWSIAGNHDLPYADIVNKKQSIFSHFTKHKFLEDIEEQNGESDICGFDYRNSTTELLKLIKTSELSRILVIHENTIPKPNLIHRNATHITYEQVWEAINSNTTTKVKPEIVICGHYHKGFPTQKYKGLYFINPYSLTRLARDEYVVNGEHIPQVVFLELPDTTETNNTDIEIETVDLEHTPYNQAFIEKEIEQATLLSIQLNNFVEKLQNVNVSVDETLKELPTDIGEQVKQLVMDYLEKAKSLN